MSQYRIRLSGLDFGLRLTADAGLEDDLREALDVAKSLFLDLEPVPGDASFEAGAHVHREAGGWRAVGSGGASFVYPAPGFAVRAIVFELEKTLVTLPTSRLLLHAGSVVRGNAACAFMAGPDQGKTTSCLHSLELGAAFLSEEVTAVEVDSWEIAPHLRSLTTAPAHVRRLAERFPLGAGRVRVLNDMEAVYVPSRLRSLPAPLRMIVVPKYDPNGADGLMEVRAADVLTEMLGYCFEPSQEHERFVDGLIALLEECRILRLSYRDGGGARTLLTEISGMLDEAGGVAASELARTPEGR